MKKLITRVLLPIIAGFSFTLASDSVHAITQEQTLVCKTVSDYVASTSQFGTMGEYAAIHFRALVSVLTLSQEAINTIEASTDNLINIAPDMASIEFMFCHVSMVNSLK